MIYTPVPVFPEDGMEKEKEEEKEGKGEGDNGRRARSRSRSLARAHDKICDGRNFPGEKIKVLASTPPYL